MFFRSHKTPLKYALDFIEIAGETARRYIHDKDYIPTQEIIEQLKDLEKAIWLQHCSLAYIIRTLNQRLLESQHEDPPDDSPSA